MARGDYTTFGGARANMASHRAFGHAEIGYIAFSMRDRRLKRWCDRAGDKSRLRCIVWMSSCDQVRNLCRLPVRFALLHRSVVLIAAYGQDVESWINYALVQFLSLTASISEPHAKTKGLELCRSVLFAILICPCVGRLESCSRLHSMRLLALVSKDCVVEA